MIDFRKKITPARELRSTANLHTALESDRGRIINSAAIRRLQQKTQVFPLERNAAVRSRLTHSLEVQQVGRFIVQRIFHYLTKAEQRNYGLLDLERPLESLVEMACLMHDIGNPPFGHFGEAAINQWFQTHLESITPERCKTANTGISVIFKHLRDDIQNFEGNAQGIRIVHSLLSLNLTYSQTAGILKYTRPASMAKSDSPKDKNYLMKKVGYYFSEKPFIEALQNELEIKQYCRHPVSYIMEAADDISYCLADIEDAVEKGIISVESLCEKLKYQYTRTLINLTIDDTEHLDFAEKAIDYAYNKASEQPYNFNSEFFIYLRVSLMHPLVNHAAKRFIEHIDAIYHGDFNQALLEDKSYLHAVTKTLKQVALEHVFCHQEVGKLELQGYRIISGLLDCYKPLLALNSDAFKRVLKGDTGFLIESRLIKKLSKKHINSYQKAIDHLTDEPDHFAAYEFYYRCRLIQDYISGMTDQFAYDEYRSLMVID
ncbi:dGTPase [Pseudoalteromonas shioyasakiensis]|uniref:dGTPase n=1 Tax=Pseudoalteromonas shioyasakiensis TaxID=1190813 RepID=UPI00211879C3|nr:dGTPase [Pseudoalteromonas shioyasakiensis]MCQ8878248.1 dGTPase [Pseudoalteromonas shioyasakiensis]